VLKVPLNTEQTNYCWEGAVGVALQWPFFTHNSGIPTCGLNGLPVLPLNIILHWI